MEVLGEPPDRTDVGKCGSLRVITALEFLEHPFAKLGHRDLLVTQTYLLAASDASPCHHAQRPPRERLSSNGVTGNWRGHMSENSRRCAGMEPRDGSASCLKATLLQQHFEHASLGGAGEGLRGFGEGEAGGDQLLDMDQRVIEHGQRS